MSFGYGPVGKLLTICKRLQSEGVEMVLVADKLALQLASLTDYFTDIVPFDFINSDLSEHEKLRPLFQGADLMLNVLEPDAVEFANQFGVPTVYVDSLFWMWDELPESLHNVHYIAQTFPGVDKKLDQFQEHLASFNLCGPIVDTSYKEGGERENFLLISFAGMESPFTKFGKNLYYPVAVLSNLLQPLNNSSYEKIVITGNSSIMEFFQEKYGEQFRGEFTHLSHDKFLEALATCKMVVASPGLTTTYEALVYETPIRYLPPQNYSQTLMLTGHQARGFADIAMNWSNIYPEYSIPADMPEADGVALVEETIVRFATDSAGQEIAKEILTDMLTAEPPSSHAQREALGEKLTDGTSEIVKIVLEKLAVTVTA